MSLTQPLKKINKKPVHNFLINLVDSQKKTDKQNALLV